MSSVAHAGAWPIPAGKGQIITTTVTDNAHKGFDDRWKLSQDVSFSKFETQFYWEHGLSQKITLVASTAYQDVDFISRLGEESVTGFGSSSLGARYLFYNKGNTVGSLQGNFIFAGKGEVISDADLGRGGNGIELRGLLGRSFTLFQKDGFIDLQSAWIYRGDDSPHTFKIDAAAGWHVTKKRQIIGQIFYAWTGLKPLILTVFWPTSLSKLKLHSSTGARQRHPHNSGFFKPSPDEILSRKRVSLPQCGVVIEADYSAPVSFLIYSIRSLRSSTLRIPTKAI